MIPDINRLLRAIKKGKVVLVIGPDAIPYKNTKGEVSTFSQLVRNKICTELHSDKYNYFEQERLFNFKDADSKLAAQEIVQEMSSSKEWVPDQELLKMIISLPLPLVFNINPEKEVYRTFGKYWKYPQFGYLSAYQHQDKSFEDVEPLHNPILFQLAGSSEDDEKSIILDYHDLFGALKNMLSGAMESTQLVRQLNKTTHYLLMGVNLNRWYFQLLLHYINHLGPASPFQNTNKNIVLYCNIADVTQQFLKEQFLIEQTDLNRNDFETLFTAIKESNDDGISLRNLHVEKADGVSIDKKLKIRDLLKENRFIPAFSILNNSFENNEYLNELAVLQGSLQQINNSFQGGDISASERDRKLSKLRLNLMEYFVPKL